MSLDSGSCVFYSDFSWIFYSLFLSRSELSGDDTQLTRSCGTVFFTTRTSMSTVVIESTTLFAYGLPIYDLALCQTGCWCHKDGSTILPSFGYCLLSSETVSLHKHSLRRTGLHVRQYHAQLLISCCHGHQYIAWQHLAKASSETVYSN